MKASSTHPRKLAKVLYLQAFILSGILCLIAAVCVLQIGQSPTKSNSQLSSVTLNP